MNAKHVDVIDVGPPRRRRWRLWLLGGIIIVFLALTRLLSVYISALWFGSLGYSSVYWYVFKTKLALFAVFTALTALLLSATFLLFQRLFGASAFESRTIILNNQPVQFSPAKFIRPLGWIVSAFVGLIYGFKLKDNW